MMSIEEAQLLMDRFVTLRERRLTGTDEPTEQAYAEAERLCAERFAYLIDMHTERYRGFSNHEDLRQEGMLALLKSMQTYQPGRSNFFFWSHRYIRTRVTRAANNHSVIRYPMAFAKSNIPHKLILSPEKRMPEHDSREPYPDEQVQAAELAACAKAAILTLSRRQRRIVRLAFGMNGSEPASLPVICRTMRLTKEKATVVLDKAMERLRMNIKV